MFRIFFLFLGLFCFFHQALAQSQPLPNNYRVIVTAQPEGETQLDEETQLALKNASNAVVAKVVEKLIQLALNGKEKNKLKSASQIILDAADIASSSYQGIATKGALNLNIFYIPWSDQLTWMADLTKELEFASANVVYPLLVEAHQNGNTLFLSPDQDIFENDLDVFYFEVSSFFRFTLRDLDIKQPMSTDEKVRFKAFALQARLDGDNVFNQAQVMLALNGHSLEVGENTEQARVDSFVIPNRQDRRSLPSPLSNDNVVEPMALIQVESMQYEDKVYPEISPHLISFGTDSGLNNLSSLDYFGESFDLALSVDEVAGCGDMLDAESIKSQSLPYLQGEARLGSSLFDRIQSATSALGFDIGQKLLGFKIKIFNLVVDVDPDAKDLEDGFNIVFVDSAVSLKALGGNTCFSIASVNEQLTKKFDDRLDGAIADGLEASGLNELNLDSMKMLELLNQVMQ